MVQMNFTPFIFVAQTVLVNEEFFLGWQFKMNFTPFVDGANGFGFSFQSNPFGPFKMLVRAHLKIHVTILKL